MDKSLQIFMILAIGAAGANSSPAYGKEHAHHASGHAPKRSEVEKRLEIVSRDDWGARPPKNTSKMSHPVPYVIIHHSYIPEACDTPEKCVAAMQSMQIMHQDTNNWDDIGYNFAIGGDGRIYTGRGWSNCGAHAPSYNNVSIGICFIGDWTQDIPPPEMTGPAHDLIEFGVNEGYISAEYEMYGHRQVRDTECPGDAFFDEITTWPHWGAKPPRYVERTTTTTEIP
ncbi:peptidoglycan-recognition protein LB-like isoform X2 [Atheta coriaria]|uniref:peptidoglycan-recognition protein LB-like isoform X2 n=1 Tax=Dalotia coriaria TaxID=877792 RepID=UPI0031F3695A